MSPNDTDHAAAEAKVEKPATHFDDAHEIVVDPSLSPNQKTEALDTLEQDARQLATASSEGMTGGEPTKLHEILVAKDAMELPPLAQAYQIVLQDLHARLGKDANRETRSCIEQAIGSLETLERTVAHAA